MSTSVFSNEPMDPGLARAFSRGYGVPKRFGGRGSKSLASYRPRRVVRRRRNVGVRYGGYINPQREEFKTKDTSISQVQDTTGALTLVNGVARGDDIGDRTGRKVIIKSIEAHFISGVTSATGVDQYQRLILFVDHQPNGAAPAATDLLVSNSYQSLKNLDNRARFTILYDRVYALNAAGESGSKIVLPTYYKRVNIPVIFNSGDAGTIADIQTNSIYLLSVGSEAAGNTAGSTVGRVRIRYTDA